jgi:uncharacterized protein (DUF952 family)
VTFIYHVATRADWAQALETGEYRISTLGRSLEDEGFIHSSTDQQVERVANRYYRGVSDLLLLIIDLDRVKAEGRFDPVGNETYPHIYGPLNVDAVVRVTPLIANADGGFTIPDTMLR